MIKNKQKNNQNDRKFATILGINLLSTQTTRLLTSLEEQISHSINNPKNKVKLRVTTPNPELVLMAQANKPLKDALNSANFNVPDGIGLAQASLFNSFKLPQTVFLKYIYGLSYGLYVGLLTLTNPTRVFSSLNIIKGRQLFLDLIELASKNKWKVFLLGGENNEADLAARLLKDKFTKLNIMSFGGPILDKNANPVSKVDIKLQIDAVDRINKFSPNLLFVAFENPKQEIWAMENLGKLNVNLIMSVGGTYRYISGMRSLPPRWMESLGLEWLWRLLTEPTRLKRVLNAFPVFPWKVFLAKVSSNS